VLTAWRRDLAISVHPHRSIRVDTNDIVVVQAGIVGCARDYDLSRSLQVTLVWVYQSHSDARSIFLGVPELVLNYELDKVLFVSVCQAHLAILVSCRVELTWKLCLSGVPVNILPSR
jgi:hypothetical protein